MHKLGKRIPLDEMPPVPVYKLSHIVLRSADVGAARDWYMAVINARMVFEADDGMGCALTFDEEHHRLLIVGMPEKDVAAQRGLGTFFQQIDKRRAMSGLEHISFTYDGVGVWLANYKRCKKRGIEPVMCVNHGPVLSMYYLDPDGNSVEIQTDTMPMDQAFEFMYSDAFADNPIGAPFDPDELCARYEAGTPLREIASTGWE